MNSAKVVRFENIGDTNDTGLHYGWITAIRDESFTIDRCVESRPAASLPLSPKIGDYVAYIDTKEGRFVISILIAAEPDHASLKFPNAKKLEVFAEHIDIVGTKTVSLSAVSELSLQTCRNFKLSCANLFQTATDSVIGVARNWLQRCDQGAVEAKDLLRTNAGNQIITAEKDMRLDAERINMG